MWTCKLKYDAEKITGGDHYGVHSQRMFQTQVFEAQDDASAVKQAEEWWRSILISDPTAWFCSLTAEKKIDWKPEEKKSK